VADGTLKGGIVAEMDALEDMTEAEEKWAQSDTIVWQPPAACLSRRSRSPKNLLSSKHLPS
jgi:hypothetical protein